MCGAATDTPQHAFFDCPELAVERRIWRAELQKAANQLSETVANGGDGAAIGANVKALGRTCGGCHKEFRKPKEESYKAK